MTPDLTAAPCGLLVLRGDGTVVDVNATLLSWLGRRREDVVEALRLPDLLTVGGRIYWETHLGPLLHVDGRFDEVALDLRAPQERLPVLVSALRDPVTELVHASVTVARERTRYERELLAARQDAERSEARLLALQQVTAELSTALGVVGVADVLRTAGTGALGGARVDLWLADEDGRLQPAPGTSDQPPSGIHVQQRSAVLRDGSVLVPLHGSTTVQGVLAVRPRDDAGADPLDLEVLTAVGQQAGLALDRARLYEQSAAVAHELQRSLLAVEPPQDARFAVATTYRPGVELLEVGGDWYDVFLARQGVLSLVVGDVVGRGLGAASAMGQLRSAVRAVAGPDTGPAALLGRLDRFVDQVEAASLATVAYAELDLSSGELVYTCAGHPPPVLVPAAGPAQLLWGGRSTPLGSFVGRARTAATLQLSPGDRVLLYTDGLVERRDRSLDEGLQRLLETAEATRGTALGEAVRRLTATMLEDERTRDDVCVLLLSWADVPFERRLPADLTTLSEARRSLGGWLDAQGVPDRPRDDLVLAASEAVANAAEHGSGRRSDATVRLRAHVEEAADGMRDVVVSVHDGGRWRAPTASDERGRGLLIIGQLVDDVVVQAGDGTTVVLRRRFAGTAS